MVQAIFSCKEIDLLTQAAFSVVERVICVAKSKTYGQWPSPLDVHSCSGFLFGANKFQLGQSQCIYAAVIWERYWNVGPCTWPGTYSWPLFFLRSMRMLLPRCTQTPNNEWCKREWVTRKAAGHGLVVYIMGIQAHSPNGNFSKIAFGWVLTHP